MANPHIHPDNSRFAVAGRDMPLNLHCEGDEPPVGLTADGGGQDVGGALLQPASELARRLVRLEDSDSGELDVLTVAQHLDLASGESTGVSGATLPLESWKADWAAFAATCPGVAPVLERPGQPIQAG